MPLRLPCVKVKHFSAICEYLAVFPGLFIPAEVPRTLKKGKPLCFYLDVFMYPKVSYITPDVG